MSLTCFFVSMVFVKIVYLKPLTKHITLLRDLEAATVLEALGVVPKTQWPSTEALMHELSTDSEVTFRRGLGSATPENPHRENLQPLHMLQITVHMCFTAREQAMCAVWKN